MTNHFELLKMPYELRGGKKRGELIAFKNVYSYLIYRNLLQPFNLLIARTKWGGTFQQICTSVLGLLSHWLEQVRISYNCQFYSYKYDHFPFRKKQEKNAVHSFLVEHNYISMLKS